MSIEDDWADLRARLERATNLLAAMMAASAGEPEAARLRAKLEGVNLALSYMREYDQ